MYSSIFSFLPCVRPLYGYVLLSLLLSITCTLTFAQSGTTYYVSSGQGSDNNSGTSSGQAWQSLSKVENTPLQPGDKVLLRRGDTWGERLFLDNVQGSASARIIVGVYGSEDAPRPVLNPGSPSRVVRLENSHYITVENLNIRVPQDKSGILIKGDSRYCTVRNCLVTSSKGNIGIVYSSYLKEADARPTYSVVSNCEVSGFREGIVGSGGINGGGKIENNYVHSARTDVAGDLIRAHGSREKKGDYNGLVITGNRLTQWTDDAIDLYTGSDVIVEYNEIYRGEYPLFNNGTNNGSGNGIKLGGVTNPSSPAPTSSGNIARYNKIYDLSPREKLAGNRNFLSNGIDTNGGIGAEIYGNLIYDVDGNAIVAGDGSQVYNNTCRADTKATLFVNGSNVRVYNNIFSSSIKEISVKTGAMATGSNNLLENGSSDAAYNGTNDLNGNPGFVNPGANNYKLTAGSIAVDAGTSFGNYNQDREGNPIMGARDIGSYEFQGSMVDPPTSGITIRLAGASTTKNDDPNHPNLRGWGDELAPSMKDEVTVVNYADPGESTKSFIDRGFWATLLADIQSGDYVIIHFGHNDSKDDPEKATTPGTSPNYDGTYKANLKRMTQDVLDRGGIPIISSPVERTKWINNILQNTHDNYVPAAEKAAQEKNIVYLNMWSQSRVWMENAGEQQMISYFPGYLSKSPGNTDLVPGVDFTHTNVAGARQNAEAFIIQLQASNSPLKQYIKDQQPPVNSDNGIAYSYYEGDWQQLPDFSSLTAIKTGTLTNFSLSPAEQADYYGLVYTTYLEVTTAGEYTFYANSDDGTKLFIDNQLVVDNDGRHSTREESGTITLAAGRHLLRVEYFEAFSSETLEVSYAGPGISKQLIPGNLLYLEDNTVPPTASTEVWLEGECANSIGSNWEVVSDTTASGGNYLRAKQNGFQRDQVPGEASSRVSYTFAVSEAGAYKIFTRHLSFNGEDDSFWIQINEGEWINAYLGDNRGSLTWAQLGRTATYALSAGTNTIRLAYREPNARLDKIYITLEGSIPNGEGQAVTNCANTPPEPLVKANAGQDQTVSVNVSQPYQIRGGAEGPNPFRRYLWEKVSGPSLTLNGNSANAKLSNLQVGTYVLRFTATDSEGNSGSDEMTLTVTGSNARLTNGAKEPLESKGALRASELRVYPNPVSDRLEVYFNSNTVAPVTLHLTDLSGRVVYQHQEIRAKGRHKIAVPVTNLPKGMYLLRWQQGTEQQVHKILIER